MMADRRFAPSELPKLGLGLLSFNLTPSHSFTWTGSYRQAICDARRAEALGLESVWLSEHHFVADGYCPALLPAAGTLLQATETLIVGTAALLLPLADGRRLARQLRSLGTLRERFRLGVAIGYRGEEFQGMGRDRRKRGRMMDAMLEDLISEFGTEGIIICASSPVAVERAIRYQLPMLTDEAAPVSTALEWGSRFREATDQELTMYRGLWLSPDGTAPPEKVWERDLAYWQYLAWDYEPSWLDDTPSEADPFLRSQPDIETMARQGEEKWLRCTPPEFAAFLRRLGENGFDRFIARISWAGTPLDEGVMRALSTIAGGQVAR